MCQPLQIFYYQKYEIKYSLRSKVHTIPYNIQFSKYYNIVYLNKYKTGTYKLKIIFNTTIENRWIL